MFRNVSEETAGKLMKDDRFTDAGLREDPAYVVTTDPDIVCGMVAVDETGLSAEPGRACQREHAKRKR